MAQYDYNPPTQPQAPPDPANQWFNSLPSQEQPMPTKPTGSKKPVIIGGGVIAVLAVILGALTLMTPATSAVCLTTDDYKAISGMEFQDDAAFSPSESFYAATLRFDNGSFDIDEANETVLRRIGSFYAARGSDKPIVVTIDGGYTKNDTEEAAQNRVNAISDTLVSAGVDRNAIIVSEVLAINAGEELSDDSEELARSSVYVNVTSDQQCQQ